MWVGQILKYNVHKTEHFLYSGKGKLKKWILNFRMLGFCWVTYWQKYNIWGQTQQCAISGALYPCQWNIFVAGSFVLPWVTLDVFNSVVQFIKPFKWPTFYYLNCSYVCVGYVYVVQVPAEAGLLASFLELDLKAAVSQSMWLLGSKLSSIAEAAHALNHWAIPQAP